MGKAVFITGTDTDAGKSVVTAQLLRGLGRAGLRVAGMKPVASGCEWRDGRLWSADVAVHAAASTVPVASELAAPYLFEPPVSPHIAAREAGVRIDLAHLQHCLAGLRQQTDVVLVEGAGGWLAPLSDELTMADLAAALDLPVILVVGMRLGCINHAMLSAAAILASSCRLLGWVANPLEPAMNRYADNLAYLTAHMPAPLLAELEHRPDAGELVLPVDSGLLAALELPVRQS
ncbi:dethiobiotin synthase [Chitinilyticum aquatile]|uniref:dethiobiotin synthase n=1 Tax=Chitinilyticum aquatile TaxID=362520 RepID=UPI00040BC5A7|nr:dethiobiotin synthase [Chitinilyticum aquatile]